MTDAGRPLDWAPHTFERRPYRQRVARGPRADRQLREITVALPPFIRDRDFPIDRPLAAMTTASAGDLGHLDLVHGRTLKALNHLQLRTEAVDSSKIENVDASLADYGRALLGVGANASAVSMASATAALSRMIRDAETTRSIRHGGDPHRAPRAVPPPPRRGAPGGHPAHHAELGRRQRLLPRHRAPRPAAAGDGARLPRRPGRVRQPRRRAHARAGRDRARPVRVDPPVHRRQRPDRPGAHPCRAPPPPGHPPPHRADRVGPGRPPRALLRRAGPLPPRVAAPLIAMLAVGDQRRHRRVVAYGGAPARSPHGVARRGRRLPTRYDAAPAARPADRGADRQRRAGDGAHRHLASRRPSRRSRRSSTRGC